MMKYHISLTQSYKEELKFLQEMFAKELDSNRTCVIETSDEMNQSLQDNHIHYESKEVEVARYIDDIMLKLPTIFNG